MVKAAEATNSPLAHSAGASLERVIMTLISAGPTSRGKASGVIAIACRSASASAAVAVRGEPNHMAVFYIGTNGHLTASIFDGGPWWGPPTDLGGISLKGELSATSPVPHELDVFYTAISVELYESQWVGGPWWSAPFPRAVRSMGGGTSANGREVYVQAFNGHLSVAHRHNTSTLVQQMPRTTGSVEPYAAPPCGSESNDNEKSASTRRLPHGSRYRTSNYP